MCFNTQPPEGGWSRGIKQFLPINCFNTQPPEGGWDYPAYFISSENSFNTQPPEGGWLKLGKGLATLCVSTHSRLKAAGNSLNSKNT